MKEALVEVVADVVAIALFSVGATALAVIGLLMEQTGLSSLTAGEVVVGLWYVYMGGVVLFVAVYLLGYRQVIPRAGRLVDPDPTTTE